ncbi:NADP-dependent oxidoreductase [Asanoa sp. WMMD1127]|uniref:quinone oxidoreductase family protein n=1 Tax=Asanoa sp. WMMD1127 TaxID=3016107 RepID=UPI002416BDC5|nr:NADP-dependent oxidoreductase [Asanoa sp. WMMD1127]MDG4826719.1 NADP-dependent oxidoreductase [Asanoa sp. WMMD1127]
MLDIPVPNPGPGQVRVAVEAASVNGIDAATGAGLLWDSVPHRFPVVLGRDFAGTVERVGPGVATIRPRDRVAGVITGMTLARGALTDTIIFDARSVVPLPPGISEEQAAAAGLAAVTAKALVDTLALTADDIVLVAGATGGVGAFAVQLARATGATVYATARPGEPTEFVRGLGANETLDYTDGLAAPPGLTAIAHAAGDAATLGAMLPPGGRFSSAIGATAEAIGRDDLTVTPIQPTATPETVGTILDAIASGALRVPITHTYAMSDAPRALADFGGHKLGKLVVDTRR